MRKKSQILILAKVLIAIPVIWYGFVPPLIDVASSHVLNPDWPGHARFHVVWILSTNTLLSITALIFLFKPGANSTRGPLIAGLISLCVYAGFFLSLFTMSAYGGTLSDSNAGPKILGIDGNLFAFSILTTMLMIGMLLSFRINQSQSH